MMGAWWERRGRVLVAVVLAAVLVAIAYDNGLDNGFHFDDGHSVQDNAYLRDLSHLPTYFTDVRAFSPLAENRSYRPLLLVGYALSYRWGHGEAWAFHLLSFILHALTAAAAGLLARRLLAAAGHGEWAQRVGLMAGTALFAVHPLLTETVNYISARSSLQGATFALSSVLLYVWGRETGRRAGLIGAALCLAAGMLTKLTAVTVPALLVLWELLLAKDPEPPIRRLKAVALRVLPFALVAGALTVLHEALVGAYARGARSDITAWSHLLTQTQVWMRYQALFIWPQDLCADLTMRWSQSPLEGPTARAILFVVAVMVAAWVGRRRWPAATFGILWYYITLSPTNSFMPLSEPATEHRVYIAFFGLLLVLLDLGLGWAAVTRARKLAFVGATVVVAALLTATTITRNRVWRDDVTLWGSVIQCAPDNARAHLNYGRGLLGLGDRVGARREYDKCAELWPRYPFCVINQAALAWIEERYADADRYAQAALQLAPGNVYARHWRGVVDLALERYADAARAFEGALEVAPGFDDAERGLAVALFEQGDLEGATRLLTPLAAAGALDGPSWFAWGYLRQRAGDPAAALEAYDRALTLDPKLKRARYNRAVLHHQAGRLDLALLDYAELAGSPDAGPDVLYNLALAQWGTGAQDAARQTRARLARLVPDYPGLATLDQTMGPPP